MIADNRLENGYKQGRKIIQGQILSLRMSKEG